MNKCFDKARQAAREARVLKIEARGKITAFTADGREHSGFPVLKDEWPSCRKGMKVIVVDYINDETKTFGKPTETFVVVKEPCKNPRKGNVWEVFANYTPTTLVIPKPVGSLATIDLYRGGEVRRGVRIFASTDDIREARANGLNGGTLAGVKSPKSTYRVYAVHYKELKDLGGNFRPL